LFASNCSGCHGPEGQGSQRAPSLNVLSFLQSANDTAISQIITMGVPDTAMPAWGDRMTTEQIHSIVGFIRSWEPNAPEIAVPVIMTGPWWRTGGSSMGASGIGRGMDMGSTGQTQPVQPANSTLSTLNVQNSAWLATQLVAMNTQTAQPHTIPVGPIQSVPQVTQAATLDPQNSEWLATQLGTPSAATLDPSQPAPLGTPTPQDLQPTQHLPQAFITQTAAAELGIPGWVSADDHGGGQGGGQGHGRGQGVGIQMTQVVESAESFETDSGMQIGVLFGIGLAAVALSLLGLGVVGMYIYRRK
jgi:hypothetical protein